jgi:Phage integrase, N-terminal SAM-like domain
MGDSTSKPPVLPIRLSTFAVPAQTPSGHLTNAPKPRLLDQVHQAIRTRQHSYKTEKTYVGWIKQFIFFITSVIPRR